MMTEQEAIKWLKAWSATHQNENDNIREAVWVAITALEEIQQYRNLMRILKKRGTALDILNGEYTVDNLVKALEKQIPKKQGNANDEESHLRLSKDGFLCCSRTNKPIRYPLISFADLEYCPRCGQKLED